MAGRQSPPHVCAELLRRARGTSPPLVRIRDRDCPSLVMECPNSTEIRPEITIKAGVYGNRNLKLNVVEDEELGLGTKLAVIADPVKPHKLRPVFGDAARIAVYKARRVVVEEMSHMIDIVGPAEKGSPLPLPDPASKCPYRNSWIAPPAGHRRNGRPPNPFGNTILVRDRHVES